MEVPALVALDRTVVDPACVEFRKLVEGLLVRLKDVNMRVKTAAQNTLVSLILGNERFNEIADRLNFH